jgi:hypothetical protein
MREKQSTRAAGPAIDVWVIINSWVVTWSSGSGSHNRLGPKSFRPDVVAKIYPSNFKELHKI